jgi:hypothetical protein
MRSPSPRTSEGVLPFQRCRALKTIIGPPSPPPQSLDRTLKPILRVKVEMLFLHRANRTQASLMTITQRILPVTATRPRFHLRSQKSPNPLTVSTKLTLAPAFLPSSPNCLMSLTAQYLNWPLRMVAAHHAHLYRRKCNRGSNLSCIAGLCCGSRTQYLYFVALFKMHPQAKQGNSWLQASKY